MNKSLLIILFFSSLVHAQYDTLTIYNVKQTINRDKSTIVYKSLNNDILQNAIIKDKECFLFIRNGELYKKECYGENGQMASVLEKKDDHYILEEFSSDKKVVIEKNMLLEDENYYEYYLNNNLKIKGECKGNQKGLFTFYDVKGNQIFQIDYGLENPRFIGDTLNGTEKTLFNGLIKRNDTLYAMQENQVVGYKFFKNNQVELYSGQERKIKYRNASKYEVYNLLSTKPQSHYYTRYDNQGNIEVKLKCLNGTISQLEYNLPKKKIILEYSFEQLQRLQIYDYFEGGHFYTVKTNQSIKKYRVVNEFGILREEEIGTTSQDLIQSETGNAGEYSITGNVIRKEFYISLKEKCNCW